MKTTPCCGRLTDVEHLAACVRRLVSSFLHYMLYLRGGEMGLSQWNSKLRTPQYPPISISDALDFSSSDTVEEAYRMTEDLFIGKACAYVLPPWAMTWPGGQLTGIGRNGCYTHNIARYESIFSKAFSEEDSLSVTQNTDKVPLTSKLRYVNVVPIEFLRDEGKLKKTLTSLVSQIDTRRGGRSPALREQMVDCCISNGIHRNACGSLSKSYLEPTKEDVEQFKEFFFKDSAELGHVTGLSLSWMTPDEPLP